MTTFRDAGGVTRWRKSLGVGTEADPFVLDFRDEAARASLASLDGKLPTLGAKAGVGSVSVVPATDTVFPVNGRPLYGTTTLAVTNTLATGAFLLIEGLRRMRIQLHNTGATQITQVEISSNPHSAGDFQTHLSTSAHYLTPSEGSILRHCGDLDGAPFNPTLFNGTAKCILALDLSDFFGREVRIRARTASGTTNLAITWGGSY